MRLKHGKLHPNLVLLILASSFLILTSCGGSGSETTAISTDSIIVPADQTKTWGTGGSVLNGTCFPGGTVILTPLTIVVKDASGSPKAGINVDLFTDGFWYTDDTYNNFLQGVGLLNHIVVQTDSSGNASINNTTFVFWSTAVLPPATPPSGTNAGADQNGTSFVQAYSGAISSTFNYNWTVKGCGP